MKGIQNEKIRGGRGGPEVEGKDLRCSKCKEVYVTKVYKEWWEKGAKVSVMERMSDGG